VYHPRPWANFRLHGRAKTLTSDDRCYPEMLRVHQREGGKWLSRMRLKAAARSLFYARLPLRVQLWLRRWISF
jgi:hypothetical protein